MNLKSTIKLIVLCLCVQFNSFAQEIIEETETKTPHKKKDSILNKSRIKADGVSAVVGDFIVLESDLDREIAQLEAQGADLEGVTRCELFGSLLENKLYAHQAIQDSIVVNELFIQSRVEQQINGFLQQTGKGVDELVKFYKKDSEEALREAMYEINKNGYLTSEMRKKVVEDVEVTPEEVRTFFNNIPEDERPIFGTELKIAQIVVYPEITEKAKEDVINKLKGFKKDVEENGASFTTKVLFYTDDTASKRTGGKYTLNRKQPRFVKEFRDVAFSLQEGEISEPFESIFGYHIILLEKIRGQEYEVRHILLKPEFTPEDIQKAKDKLEDVRSKIVDGTLTFAEAAREFSNEKETKYEGGQLTNPLTQDFNFELTKMEPELYSQIQNLKDGEVSPIYQDEDREHEVKFKILTVTDRTDDHKADFAKDYLKIKNLALQDKQIEVIGKWQTEAIKETFVKVNGEYRKCEFQSNWLKK